MRNCKQYIISNNAAPNITLFCDTVHVPKSYENIRKNMSVGSTSRPKEDCRTLEVVHNYLENLVT